MWTITNHTPFAAERGWARDKDGAEVWMVAVRGTFLLGGDGSTQLAPEQEPVRLVPEYHGEPGRSSLRYDSDLLSEKVTTDVLLHGSAHAPGGRLVTELDVTLGVADANRTLVDKTLRVFGARVVTGTGVLGRVRSSDPEPFGRTEIRYERAYGGPDLPTNPLGFGSAKRKGEPMPNVEDPDRLLGSWRAPNPVGFGPLPGNWPQRLRHAGTYDARWEQERLPLLPRDFDSRFYQCAPENQQTPNFLTGGEEVTLTNLTPSGTLRFLLPRVSLRFRTQFGAGDVEDHRAALHTVVIEPDRSRLGMVWHTRLPCHHKVLRLQNTTITLLRRLNVPDREGRRGVWIGPR